MQTPSGEDFHAVHRERDEAQARVKELEAQLAALDLSLVCTICQDVFGADPVTLNCGHAFCSRCVRDWLASNRSCPDCRASVSAVPPCKSIALAQLSLARGGGKSTGNPACGSAGTGSGGLAPEACAGSCGYKRHSNPPAHFTPQDTSFCCRHCRLSRGSGLSQHGGHCESSPALGGGFRAAGGGVSSTAAGERRGANSPGAPIPLCDICGYWCEAVEIGMYCPRYCDVCTQVVPDGEIGYRCDRCDFGVCFDCEDGSGSSFVTRASESTSTDQHTRCARNTRLGLCELITRNTPSSLAFAARSLCF